MAFVCQNELNGVLGFYLNSIEHPASEHEPSGLKPGQIEPFRLTGGKK
ncbi:MAG TPA: hypothetical protein VN890_10305 [Methylocella sp.]|nr:hypothetical protein [Methylocella sp.]